MDYKGAFESVDNNVLLLKTFHMGIKGKVGKWITSFLADRTQKVKVDNALSSVSRVVSGVPQGSVLGPLLFVIMMTDIDEELTSATVTSFADDTRLCQRIASVQDQQSLQAEAEKVFQWAKNNNLAFNPSRGGGGRIPPPPMVFYVPYREFCTQCRNFW